MISKTFLVYPTEMAPKHSWASKHREGPKPKRSQKEVEAEVADLPDFAMVSPTPNSETRLLPFVNKDVLTEILKGLRTSETMIGRVVKKENLTESDVRDLWESS